MDQTEVPNYEYQEIIRAGEAAAQQLGNPVFNAAYQMTLQDITTRMFKCEPGHTKTMEELRRQANSLTHVVRALQVMVNRAEAEFKQRAMQPNEPEGAF